MKKTSPVSLAVLCALAIGSASAALHAQTAETSDAGASASDDIFKTEPKRYRLGTARVFTNDLIDGRQDRWRTGSVTTSRAYGFGWDGAAPSRFGELLELRIQGQIITPEDLGKFDPDDRPWAGALSFGLHSHSTFHGAEIAVGADIVVIGPQTHLDDFQEWLHELISAPTPSEDVLANQIEDTIRPTFVAEIGKQYQLGVTSVLRPFAEFRAGDETLGRIGADFTYGLAGRGELLARENVTGQRYRVVRSDHPTGLSFSFGGDVAYVSDSVFLPESRGYELTDTRNRLRAGLSWESDGATIFTGVTYLDREFEGQREGQYTGTFRVRLSF